MSALPPIRYLRAWAEPAEPDSVYRYELGRVWDHDLDLVLFLMLNPSKAAAFDASGKAIDDPTIRKCVGFARRLGYGGILVANMFGFRATYPAEFAHAADPIGDADSALGELLVRPRVGCVLAAWGSHPRNAPWLRERERKFCGLLQAHSNASGRVIHALKFNHGRAPKHPLMASYSLVTERKPEPFIWPRLRS